MAPYAAGTTCVTGCSCVKGHEVTACLESVSVHVTLRAVAVRMRKIVRLWRIGSVVLVSCRLRVANFTDFG